MSDLGRVRSLDRRIPRVCGRRPNPNETRLIKGTILKPGIVGKGYLSICLCKNDPVYPKGKRKYVHRLVAEAFIPNPQNLPEVDHQNRIKSDNAIGNLQWVTKLRNMQLGFERGSHRGVRKSYGEKHGNAVFKESDIRFIRENIAPRGPISYTEMANRFCVARSTIFNLVTKRTWAHVS